MYLFSCVFYALIFAAYSASIKDGYESALLGPSECLQSNYWCTNFTTATKCNAVKHCIQTVWTTKKSVSASCSDCKTTIQKIRDNVDSNTTKTALEDLLDSVCDISYITAIFRKTCEKLINQYVDDNLNELLDLLKSEVDGSTICHLLGFCTTATQQISNVQKIVQNPYRDDAVVRFENIELHFPIEYLHLPDMSNLLGASKCSWGPSYWCNNVTTSRECQTTSHCIENVWERNDFPEDNDSVCQICKNMVKQARDQLQSNETQEELKEVFEGSCKLIPIGIIKKECIAVVDEFIPELTEMLVSAMDPNAVCSVAGLCNSARIDQLITSHADKLVELDMCTNCSVAFTEIGRYLRNNPKSTVLTRFSKICGEFSTYSDACVNFVGKHFDLFYSKLLTSQPWETCHISGMCAYKYHFHGTEEDVETFKRAELVMRSKSDDLPCDLCKQLITHFKEILTANTTEDEFLEVLEGICQQTGKFEKECLEFVKDNFKVIYNFVTQELDPPTICAEVNLCPRKNFVSDANLNLIANGRFMPVTIPKPVETSTAVAVTGPMECRFCRMIIELIQRQLTDPTVEHDIEKILKDICYVVPSSNKAACKKFIEQYYETLIDILAQETDPGVVCSVLDVCYDIRLESNFQLCPLCQQLLHFLQNELQDSKTQEEIQKAAVQVCNIAPKADQQECREFVNQYTALILNVLEEEIDPTLVCPALKLCPSRSSSIQQKCIDCQTTMNAVINSLKNRTSLHIMTQVLKKVPKASETAIQLKLEHSHDIVDMMTAEFNADESCTYLKYCELTSALSFQSQHSYEVEPVIKSSAKPSCEMCQFFVNRWEKKLSSKTTIDELEQYLTKFCNELKDADAKKKCVASIDDFVPKLIVLLQKDVPPKKLCHLAQFCSASLADTSLEECRACELAIGSLQGVLSDPSISNVPLTELSKLCSDLKDKTKQVCEIVILELGPQIENIVFGIPSWFYCSKLHMCPYDQELIKTEVCQRGETFWCQAEQTAAICNKLDHCRENVWKSDKPSRS